MPRPKARRQADLCAQLADVIGRSTPVGERVARLGAPEHLRRQEDAAAALVAGKAVRVSYDELSTALWNLGGVHEARAVEQGVSVYVVAPDGSYEPA